MGDVCEGRVELGTGSYDVAAFKDELVVDNDEEPKCDGSFTNAYRYHISVCEPLTYAGCTAAGACQFDASQPAYIPLGLTAQRQVMALDNAAEGFRVVMTGGERTFDGLDRMATVDFICVPEEQTADVPCLRNEVFGLQTLDYQFEYRHHLACDGASGGGAPGGVSPGTVLLILAPIFVALYCALGAAYQYRVRDARGADLVPHREFWRDVPLLVKDGVMFVVDKARGVAQR